MSELNSKLPRGVDLPMPVGSDEAKMFSGPATLAERDAWRKKLHAWKADAAIRIDYDGSIYDDLNLKSINSFNVALIWLWDELLFDFDSQCFTPEKLITDSQKFGGIDGIILWHAYPVLGFDSRNQFDFYNQVPGLAELIATIQSLGVDVYLNYNPWDRWTTRPAESDQQELANLIQRFKFGGVFLDTMKSAQPDFMAPILKVKPKVIVAGEARVQQERICDHVMSWAQWFGDSEIPGVIRAKWFEPRHMLHQTRRWNRSHLDELFIAWLNGAGMLLWEVVFGSWVGWNQREAQMWREMVGILRANNSLITTGEWEPLTALTQAAEAHGLFASKFTVGKKSFYTIINKNEALFEGVVLGDLVARVPGRGVAAVTAVDRKLELSNFSYEGLSTDFPVANNVRVNPLQGAEMELTISYRNRECGLFDGAPFIDAWKPLPPNYHQIFSMDVKKPVRAGELQDSEVTNAQFHEFIEKSGYQPKIVNRYLAHWHDGKPLNADLNQPVTYVDLADAQAYADWKGLVIPTEWEWQVNSTIKKASVKPVWNLTDSVQSDGRTRFLILKGGSEFNIRNGQGAKSTSGIAESDWYVDGGVKDSTWVEKLLVMGLGMNRSENIGFTCFTPMKGN